VGDELLTAIEGLIRRGDDLHAAHVAELERTVAALREVLRDLASAAMKLAEIAPPRDPADARVIEDVVGRAGKVLEYLEPASH
jgi:hypothetical protein